MNENPPFDYTKWQQQLWKDQTVDEISEAAMQLRYLAERAKRGTPEKLLTILAKAPNVDPPDVRDRI